MALSKIQVSSMADNTIHGRRNIVINGAMQVAQRATSVTGVGASAGYFTCDRWKIETNATAGRATMSQTADVHDGFANCLKLDCTTADTSIAASELFQISHKLEGQDLQQLKKGTSSAESFTVSFYVKASGSFTFGLEVFDNDNDRQMTQLFTTTTDWVRHELTFPADTTGALDDDNANSMFLSFWLHSGSTFTSGTLETSFASSTSANRAAGIDSFFSSTDNNFFLTGVQMEVGSQATPFEHRSFGEELALCQRYFFRTPDGGNSGASTTYQVLGSGYIHNSTNYLGHLIFPKTMRTSPTCSKVGNVDVLDTTGNRNISSMSLEQATSRSVLVNATITSGGTAGHGALFRLEQDSDGYIQADSEL